MSENVEDVLLREIDLTAIRYKISNKTFLGLLILLGPITGIVKQTTE